MTMYSLMIRQFVRSRMVLPALLLLLLMGIISIMIGRQFIAKQHDTILKVTEHQRAHIDRNVAAHNDMGLLLYYLRFSLISPPSDLAAVSIGQRDVNPGIQSVTIRTLEGQKYDTDLTNPVHLQSGNLDLGFVIIYLFPLIIIVFTFNLLSEEQEGGTWRLIVIQYRSGIQFLLMKLSVRVLFIMAVLTSLFVIASLTLSLPITEAWIAFFALSVLYVLFWFTLSCWITLFRQSSGFNVLTLLSIWVVMTILIPASVNAFVAATYPVPDALSTMVEQRDGYHEKWDTDRGETMQKFYSHYPQFRHYGIPTESSSWLWYYAMQQLGDDESSNHSHDMRRQILEREEAGRVISLFLPTLHTQLQFNELAQTGLKDYLRLLDSATTFHEAKRMHLYPMIFSNASVKSQDWSAFIPVYMDSRVSVRWGWMILPLICSIALFAFWTWLRTRRLHVM